MKRTASSLSPSQRRFVLCVLFAMSSGTMLGLILLSQTKFHFVVMTQTLTSTAVYSSYVNSSPDSASSRHKEPERKPSPFCQGRKIYVYDLPPAFNSALMKECNRTIVPWLEFCNHTLNGGLGIAIPGHEDWYATDLYMLEVVFHKRMMEYPCRVNVPGEADAFFIPYYSGFDALRYLYGKDRHRPAEHGRELVSWLQRNAEEWFGRNQGSDHFMITGRTAWDFHLQAKTPAEGGWGTGLLDLRELENVTLLTVEGRPWIQREQAVPYLTSFHPTSSKTLHFWLQNVFSSKRKFLFSFIGSSRRGLAIRDSLIFQCKNTSACLFVECKAIKCSHNPTAITAGNLESVFCLQPPGDSPTRRSIFDALIAGCIPVFFRNDSAYEQYTWHLPAERESYSVYISEESVVEKGFSIERILRSYPRKRIAVLQSNIIRLIPSLLYRGFGSSDLEPQFRDAFDQTVDSLLLFISRNRR